VIEIAKGNILEADAEALVNTVNCVGFMGKGIALQFKQALQRTSKPMRLPVTPARSCRAGCLFSTMEAHQSALRYQLPHKAPLARQVTHSGYPIWTEGTGRRCPQARCVLDCGTTARVRTWRAELGRSAAND